MYGFEAFQLHIYFHGKIMSMKCNDTFLRNFQFLFFIIRSIVYSSYDSLVMDGTIAFILDLIMSGN